MIAKEEKAMSIKRLNITIFASILLLLMTGCERQSDEEKQQQLQRESATKKSQPPSQAALNYKAEQKSKREIEQIENPQSSSEQEEQQDEGKELRPVERIDPSRRAQAEWPLFSSVDTDQDGSISKEEARRLEALDFHFEQVDRNKDGKIDPTEFGAFKAMQIRSFYKGGDSREQVGGAHGVPPENPHENKKSTPDEVKQTPEEDGVSVKEPKLEQKREIEQIERVEEDQPVLESQQQNEGSTDKANQPPQKEGANMGSSKGVEKEQPSFAQLDTDHDGYINKEEAKASDQLAPHFKQLDQDDNSKLDSSEFGALKAIQMQESDEYGDGEYGTPKQDKGAAD
jgi:Ca2+-binding EF-hand superfamily protein